MTLVGVPGRGLLQQRHAAETGGWSNQHFRGQVYTPLLGAFDHTPSHTKGPEDGLNVDRMNVKDGRKQPGDTVWAGHSAVQKLMAAGGGGGGWRGRRTTGPHPREPTSFSVMR